MEGLRYFGNDIEENKQKMPRCHFTAVINKMTNQVSVLKK